jgi:hypothetical protein
MVAQQVTLAAIGLAMTASLATAADLVSPPEPESEWIFTVAPYAWLAGIDGNVAAFGAPEVEVDLSIGDVLDHFDIGVMGVAEARNGRFSFGADLLWVKLSAQEDTPFGILFRDVELTAEMLVLTGIGAYSLVYEEGGNLDIFAGARLWSVKTELNFNGALLDDRSFDDDATWVDAVVGLKGRFNLSEQFYVTGWGMIGAGESDFMWDVMGGIGFSFSDSFSTVAGYRALSVDYSDDSFVYDVVQDGPILGFVFRF